MIKIAPVYRQKFKFEISGIKIKSTIVLALLWATASAFANVIWLSSTNSLTYLGQQISFGAGTRLSPYYGDFDNIIGNRVPPNTVVHLGEGVFWTKGKFDHQIPPGVTLSGEGESFTTVRRATNYLGYNSQIYCTLYSTYSNVTICNLTVDNNAFDCFSNGWTNSVLGVSLLGSGETIEHVTDINGMGLQFAPEGFQLSIGGGEQQGNRVIGCTMSNFLGTYGDGIAPVGDCLVEGNHVYLSVQPAGQKFRPLFGINVVASSKGSIVLGNHVYGGGDGFHNDTGGDTNLVIANNIFENVCSAVDLTGDQRPYNSIIISHNLMTQETNYPGSQVQQFLINIGTVLAGQTNQNITVDGNILCFYKNVSFTNDGSQGAMYVYGGANQLNQNISIINNQIDARMPVEFAGNISNLYASGNIPLNGTNFAVGNGNRGLTNFVPGQ